LASTPKEWWPVVYTVGSYVRLQLGSRSIELSRKKGMMLSSVPFPARS